MEKLAPGDPITEIDRAVIRDYMRFVDDGQGWWMGQTHGNIHLHTAMEGVRWARGHSGPAVDALLAAEALR